MFLSTSTWNLVTEIPDTKRSILEAQILNASSMPITPSLNPIQYDVTQDRSFGPLDFAASTFSSYHMPYEEFLLELFGLFLQPRRLQKAFSRHHRD
jgi:hypothetical protein